MSAEMQVQIRRNAEEMREAIADLHKWEEKIEKKDKELKETPVVAKVRYVCVGGGGGGVGGWVGGRLLVECVVCVVG